MQRYQREHVWNAIVWPLLWPLLLLQVALTVLCLVVGAIVWWASPSYASSGSMLWLMLALLVGSSLNMGAFLMLVKTRARRKDADFAEELAELERHSQALCETIAHLQPVRTCCPPKVSQSSELPLQRLARINEVLTALERCAHSAQIASVAAKNSQQLHEKTLIDDLQHHQRQLKYLLAGRERAQEESRLKSGYLALLQRETDSLLDHLNILAEKEVTDTSWLSVLNVHERLADIRALMANLVEPNDSENREELAGGSFEAHAGGSVKHLSLYSARGQALAPERSLRVLVVDDGPVNLMLARQMLETQGLQVEGVSSGEQALERQQHTRFDLVFMDIFMPTLDGLETTRRWREYERIQSRRQSVLVALTANADNAGRDACLAAGMDDLLAKPYQPESLMNMIANWFPGVIKATPSA